jgi:hypothetical protein
MNEQAVVGLDWRIVAIRIGHIFEDWIGLPILFKNLDWIANPLGSNTFFQSNPIRNYVSCVP